MMERRSEIIQPISLFQISNEFGLKQPKDGGQTSTPTHPSGKKALMIRSPSGLMASSGILWKSSRLPRQSLLVRDCWPLPWISLVWNREQPSKNIISWNLLLWQLYQVIAKNSTSLAAKSVLYQLRDGRSQIWLCCIPVIQHTGYLNKPKDTQTLSYPLVNDSLNITILYLVIKCGNQIANEIPNTTSLRFQSWVWWYTSIISVLWEAETGKAWDSLDNWVTYLDYLKTKSIGM